MRALRKLLVWAVVAMIVGTGVVVAMPWTHDLDDQVSIKPQEMPVAPPEFSVPLQGREFAKPREVEATYKNPVAADTASENRGQKRFETFCYPCHNMHGEGAGPVVQKGFMPPPMLTGSVTRGRTDGYIYSYIRHGGIIMPSYGFAVRPQEAWDIVNYVRKLQREHPTP